MQHSSLGSIRNLAAFDLKQIVGRNGHRGLVMKPEDIGYMTEIPEIYSAALKSVTNQDEYDQFVREWLYWLDIPVPAVWDEIAPQLALGRVDGEHEPSDAAVHLLIPHKIMKVAIVAMECHCPWGCAYIRMKEMGMIKF